MSYSSSNKREFNYFFMPPYNELFRIFSFCIVAFKSVAKSVDCTNGMLFSYAVI